MLAGGALKSEELDREIEATYDLTDQPFGVNIITFSPYFNSQLDACIVMRLSDIFTPKRALPSSEALVNQPEQGGMYGFDFYRDPLGATKPGMTFDEIYKAAEFQAFNTGKAVGKLRVVPVGTPYDALTFDRNDIVLLQESYPDITPVAGILATTFSTPLSHVNLRANAWRIPNAGDKQAREKYGKLDGKTVYYEVTDTGATLRRG